jgi:hypothetical protein
MTVYPRAVRHFGEAALQVREPAVGRAAPTPAPMLAPMSGWLDPPRRRRPRAVVRLWLPVTALFWILSPFPLLLAPLAWLAPAPYRPANPYAAVFAVGRLLVSLGGTVVDVDTPDALVRIRLF